jgi:hypothetical protein
MLLATVPLLSRYGKGVCSLILYHTPWQLVYRLPSRLVLQYRVPLNWCILLSANIHVNIQKRELAISKIAFLGNFAMLRKVTILFTMSVHMKRLDSHLTDFLGMYFFSKICWEKLNWNKKRIRGTLHEDQYTFLITSRSVLKRKKNVSDRSCRESQNTYFMSKNVFFNCGIYEIAWKNIVERGRPHVTT